MCGIAGYFSKTKRFSEEDLKVMTGTMIKRGPDAEGFYTENKVGLGHRRLSILDLNAIANQPMLSSNERYVIVYNGEVYNYNEIANELRISSNWQNRVDFKTSGDTEVILEAFSTYGPLFIEKLNGMFALAIYDRKNEELFLFRDRIGIKPLYYYWDGSDFLFASEINAIKKIKEKELTISKEAISCFLHLGFIPAPLSIYNEIKKLEPGGFMKISKEGVETQKYWTLKATLKENTIKNEKQALVKLGDLLMSSVLYQLKSDVPFGVFLSGGIDSSLITAQAVSLSSVKVNTFSIGFEENRYNESEHAKAISKYLGTNHYEFIVSYKDAIDNIENIFDAYGEPFSDSSAIPTMLVSKLAKQHVTVTLSGEGGDELFMGYGAYNWAKRLNHPIVKFLKNQIRQYLSLNGSNKYRRAANLFDYENDDNIQSHIFSQEQYLFSQKELRHLLDKSYSFQFQELFSRANFDQIKRLNPCEKQALFDVVFYLPDDLLTKVDRASMFHSVEARVPYLDHRIIEFALNLSPELKIKKGVQKYLLKEILYQYVPDFYFNRPKQGFAIPLESWLKNELRYLIEENLNKSVVERYNIMEYVKIEGLLKKFFAGESYLYNRIWLLIVIHRWLVKNS